MRLGPRSGALLLLVLFSLGSMGIWALAPRRFTTDLLELFPPQSAFIRDSRVLASFEPVGKVLLDVYAKLPVPPERLATFQDRVVQRLEGVPEIRRLDYSSRDERYVDLVRFYMEHREVLVDMVRDPLMFFDRDMENLRDLMEEWKRRLAGPAGFEAVYAFRRDPLDLFPNVREFFDRLRPDGFTFVDFHGRFLSEDGRHLLCFVVPSVAMLDLDGADRLFERLERAVSQVEALPDSEGIAGRFVGQVNYVVENARRTRSQVTWVMVLSLAGLCLIYVGFLKSMKLLLLTGLCVGLSLWPALGLTSLVFREVHLIGVAFGTVIAGIAVDYAIHYYVHAASPTDRHAFRRRRRAVFLGMATTCLGFVLLMAGSFPLIEQMAFLAFMAILFAYVLILAVFRWVFPLKFSEDATEEDETTEYGGKGARPLLYGAAVLLPLLVLGVSASRFDTNLKNLDFPHPELERVEREIREAYGLNRQPGVLLLEGESLEDVLDLSQRLDEALGEENDALLPSRLQPPLPVQKERRHRISMVDWTALEARTEAVGSLEGFTRGAFSPFFEEMKRKARTFEAVIPEANPFLDIHRLLVEFDSRNYGLGLIGPASEKRAEDWVRANAPDRAGFFDPATGFAKELSALKSRFAFLLFLDVLVVFGLLARAFRSPVRAASAVMPALGGVAAALLFFAGTGTALNLFHLISLVVVVSAGVDYGIFAVESGPHFKAARKGILAASATTLFTFGVFALFSNPALKSIGLTVLTGIGTSVVVSLCMGKRERSA